VGNSAAGFDPGTDQIIVSIDDGIGRITLNNPERHNTLSVEMRSALPAALAALNEDGDVRVIGLTGSGERAFSAGADISEFGEQRTTPEARAEYDRGSPFGGSVWAAVNKPVIGMIRGYCIGGGLLVALQADIRIAAAGSQFGVPAGRLGLGYATGGVRVLLDLVGPAHAAEILYSARRLDADEALRIGLVNRVVPADRLLPESEQLLGTILENGPLAVRACLEAVDAGLDVGLDEALLLEANLFGLLSGTADMREGTAAFLAKRPPQFTGA